MILLSNIIKSMRAISEQRRVLPTRQVELPSAEAPQEEGDVETAIHDRVQEKERLTMEVERLEQQILDLQQHIIEQQEALKAETEAWWKEQHQRLDTERKKVLERAQEEGYQAGYERGYQQVQQELASKLDEMEQLLRVAYQERQSIIQSAESFLLSLSTEVAKKVIQAELKLNEEQHLNIARHALRTVQDKGQVVLEVDPQQYELFRTHQEELRQYLLAGAELQIVPKQQLLSTDGCLIHTSNGSFDVTIDSQLEEIKRKLLEYFEESVAENE
jgi:flagellar assembly protein FliH